MKQISCEHYDGDGYAYALDDKTEICVCTACNLNLAAEVAKQTAMMAFIHDVEDEVNRIKNAR